MNHTPHVLHELSEYLDGECRDPGRIARHLQSCPECARRHMELLKISGHVQTLRGPETHPGFVTRVMAHAAETNVAHGGFLRLRPRLATALCLGALVVVGAWRLQPDAPAPAPPPASPTTASLQVNAAWENDAAVVEALGRLLDLGAPTDLFGDLEESTDLETPPVALDAILESLADESVEDGLIDLFDPYEISGLMDSLEDEDAQLLRELLDRYGNEV